MKLTQENKKHLENELKKIGLFPTRGEIRISISPEGVIGNIKVITNV